MKETIIFDMYEYLCEKFFETIVSWNLGLNFEFQSLIYYTYF